MARVSDLSDVTDRMLADAAAWYDHKRREMPEAFRGVNPLAVRTALRLAGGDWHRLAKNDDGSITIFNRVVW